MSEGPAAGSERLAAFAYLDARVAAQVETLALQHLAQLLLQRKVLAPDDVAAALARAAQHCGVPAGSVRRPDAAALAAVLARVGAALQRAADLEVCLCYDEPRGTQVWALRNAAADALAVAAAAAEYRADELAALRRFLDWALADDRRTAGAIAAATPQQLAAAHAALTPAVVARMVRSGWLAALPEDCPGEHRGTPRYTVGARLLAEMAPYIASTVGTDARACVICDHPVLLVCSSRHTPSLPPFPLPVGAPPFTCVCWLGWETGPPVHQRQVQHAHPQGLCRTLLFAPQPGHTCLSLLLGRVALRRSFLFSLPCHVFSLLFPFRIVFCFF